MMVVVMWVQVGVVGRTVVVVILLLLLLSGARQRLQEHLLRRDGTESHKTSSGAEGADTVDHKGTEGN